MTEAPATPGDLIDRLETHDAALAVVFRTDEGEMGGGFHLTEMKLAIIDSMDCAGRRHHWAEAVMQLLDGAGDKSMSVGKLTGILRRCTDELAGLDDAPLFVEGAVHNRGMMRFHVASVAADAGRVHIALAPETALCKPARAFSRAKVDTACCRGSTVSTAAQCCESRPI